MRATSRTTLALGDLLEIPVGIVGATESSEAKLDTYTADGAKRVQFFAHPRDVAKAHDGEDSDLEFDVLVPRTSCVIASTGEQITAYQPLGSDATLKGVMADGDAGPEFREIPAEELEAIKDAQKLPKVSIAEFIDYRTVPTDRLSGSYYVQADPGFAKPLGTLMAAMRKTGKAAVVQFALRDRQRLGVLRVRKVGGGWVLLLNIVVFADQWREPDARVLEAGAAMDAVADRAIDAAMRLMGEMTHEASNVLRTATDPYPGALAELIQRAKDGEFVTAAPAPEPTQAEQDAATVLDTSPA